jgi:hypothetical protein
MVGVLTIPGIETVHARSTWVDPRYPITGPPAPWAAIDTAVIHYTSADDLIDGDPGEHADNLPAYIRAMQRSYVDARGYSLGYWWAVDWLGGVWQIRGWEFKSAANAGHNDHTGPILVLVDGNDPATREATHSIRCLIAEGQRRSRDTWAIKGHGQLRRETGIGTATACCGTGLQRQVDDGEFVPRLEPVPTPDPSEEIDMIKLNYTVTEPDTVCITDGIFLAWVEDGHYDDVLTDAKVTTQPLVDEPGHSARAKFRGAILASRTTTAPPYTLDPADARSNGGDPELFALWKQRAL